MAWIIEKVSLTEDAKRFGKSAHYRYHIQGLNTECVPPEAFRWSVPNLEDLRYDKSRVIDVLAALDEEK